MEHRQRKPLNTMSKHHLRHVSRTEAKLLHAFCRDDCDVVSTDSDSSKDDGKEVCIMEKDESNADIIMFSHEENDVCISDINENESVNQIRMTEANRNQSLKDFLSEWAVSYGIPHNALGSLLRKLKEHDCYNDLPLDPRTLLKTPRLTDIHSIPSGQYYHFGLQKGIVRTAQAIARNSEMNRIRISINIDGIPISRSSTRQFWPILGSIFPYKPVFTIGLFYGQEKCDNVNIFLQEFVAEARKVCTEGIFINNQHVQCEINALICDAPAKAFVLCTKGHTGYSSCSKCTTEGEYRHGRICFPQINATKRTDESFIKKTDEDYHKEGITSSLLEIPNFLPVTNVPLDYMHLVCLGVMRKMLYLWTSGELQYRLQYANQEKISSNLLDTKLYIPSEFSRRPRSLQYLKLWKATEFRQILLYTGPVVLKQSLSKSVYLNYLTLHVIIRIMCMEKADSALLDYAQELVKHFISSFHLLYGKHNISHNVHNLIHLVDDVNVFGPLDTFSAFKYENYLQNFKKLIRKADKPLEQVIRRYMEKENTTHILPCVSKFSNNLFQYNLMYVHNNGPLPDNCCDPQYKNIEYPNMKLKADSLRDSCCGLIDGTIVDIKNIAYCRETHVPLIIGYEFMLKKELFTQPCSSSTIGIYAVGHISDIKTWPLSDISTKYVKLPQTNNQFAVFPLLHHDS